MKGILYIPLIIIYLISCTDEQSKKNKQKEVSNKTISTPATLDSIQWINNQIIESPNTHSLYIQKAYILWRQEKIEEALYVINKVIKMRDDNIPYYILKANILYVHNRLIEAKACYTEILEKDPTHIEANTQMGWIHLIAGMHGKCFTYCNEALKQTRTKRSLTTSKVWLIKR